MIDRLLKFKDNRKELHTLMIDLSEKEILLNYLHFERDDWWETKHFEIDPFTIIGSFNRGTTHKNRIKLAKIYARLFDIQVPVPENFDGIPVIFNMSSIFGDNGGILWDLFIEAMQYSKTEVATQSFKDAFEKAISIRGNGLANITMGLYWIRPNFFINLDSTNSNYIPQKFNIPVPDKAITGEGYIQFLNKVKSTVPHLKFPDISRMAWEGTLLERKTKKYSPGLSVEDWQDLLKDKEVFNQQSLEIMKRLKDYGGKATCTQLSNVYGETINFYNRGASALAQRIHKATQCKVYDEDGKIRWWRILFTGTLTSKEDKGYFTWQLRKELNDALNTVDLTEVKLYVLGSIVEETSGEHFINDSNEKYDKSDFLNEVYLSEEAYDILEALLINKKNIILQGAPGVGKTFAAKRLAWSMIKEKDDSRIEMIQFHQNFSYEDFIMGINPKRMDLNYKMVYLLISVTGLRLIQNTITF